MTGHVALRARPEKGVAERLFGATYHGSYISALPARPMTLGRVARAKSGARH